MKCAVCDFPHQAGHDLVREPEVALKNKPDITVSTIAADQQLVHVACELKWSDESTLYTSVYNQLGCQYLIDGAYSEGVYIVGWTGKAYQRRRSENREEGRLRLCEDLKLEAARFQENFPNKNIRVLVLPLAWETRGHSKLVRKHKRAGSNRRKAKGHRNHRRGS